MLNRFAHCSKLSLLNSPLLSASTEARSGASGSFRNTDIGPTWPALSHGQVTYVLRWHQGGQAHLFIRTSSFPWAVSMTFTALRMLSLEVTSSSRLICSNKKPYDPSVLHSRSDRLSELNSSLLYHMFTTTSDENVCTILSESFRHHQATL